MVRSKVEEPAIEPAIAEVAVNAPLHRLFHYRVPSELRGRLERGHRVLIPFGRATSTGVCVGFPESASVPELKSIQRILHPECRFDEHLLRLTRWIAEYYRAPWGEVLEAALPPSIRAGKVERAVPEVRGLRPAAELLAAAQRMGRRSPVRGRLLELLVRQPGPHRLGDLPALLQAKRETVRAAARALAGEGLVELGTAPPVRPDPCGEAGPEGTAPGKVALSSEQEHAVAAVVEALDRGGFAPFLLHGVTGSGKTEVYIRALRHAAAAGGTGLVLVPEIALTPQTVRRFRAALPGLRVAVLHSMLAAGARTAEWRAIQEGRAQVAIGARSAVFAPLASLRLIVVDEEHEPSYKQDSSPRYHGRDAAVMRARLLGIPVVLGSATPSLESYQNARTGKYRLLELPRRVTPHDLPAVTVTELGPEFYQPDGKGLISEPLDVLIKSRLGAGDQVLLYLNRRGFATFIHCPRCGFILKCSQCDLALTFHRQGGAALCHLCGEHQALPAGCPECGRPGLRRSGAGTEKIIDELARRYPEARTARLDSDSVQGPQALRAILERFGRGEIDILVGTQMIAKGHDFPRVSLVGVICADTGLHLPDFRAGERAFQLLTQVAGRAGRGERPGRVVVQTFFPGHYALRRAIAGDYPGFFEEELGHRRTLRYPPVGRAVKVTVEGRKEDRVREAAALAAGALRERGGALVLGPAPPPVARVQGRHRLQILLKGRTAAELRAALEALPERPPPGVDLVVDVDPQSLL